MKTTITAILFSLSFSVSAGQVPEWMKATVSNSTFDCGKKYCKNMSSCSEAYYKFTQCRKKGLDRDRDGIPCENVCGKTHGVMRQRLKQGR